MIEPLIALPHPDATHSLAASQCLSHFLTGSEDGFIRDYDVFTSANGKNFLTAQQRAHSGLSDLTVKSGVLRSWWENVRYAGTDIPSGPASGAQSTGRSSVLSMTVQADALWGLSGTKVSIVGLRTITVLIRVARKVLSICSLFGMTLAVYITSCEVTETPFPRCASLSMSLAC